MIHLNLTYISLFIILRTNTCLPRELYLYHSLLTDLDILFLILIFLLLPIADLQAPTKPFSITPIIPAKHRFLPSSAPLFSTCLALLILTSIKLLLLCLISPNCSFAFVIQLLSMCSFLIHISSQISPFLPRVYPSKKKPPPKIKV